MKKLTNNILAIALSAITYPAYAVIIDEESATKTDKQEKHKQENENEMSRSKKYHDGKNTIKEERAEKKSKSKKSNDDNANSMNKKPIGTTSGVSRNGSTDDTKLNEPINGTTTGTNPVTSVNPETTTK